MSGHGIRVSREIWTTSMVSEAGSGYRVCHWPQLRVAINLADSPTPKACAAPLHTLKFAASLPNLHRPLNSEDNDHQGGYVWPFACRSTLFRSIHAPTLRALLRGAAGSASAAAVSSASTASTSAAAASASALNSLASRNMTKHVQLTRPRLFTHSMFQRTQSPSN